jgi:hypothetical protein
MDSNSLQICFERPTFNMYMFILLCVLGYLVYFKFNSTEKLTDVDFYSNMDKDSLYKTIINMKDDLFTSKLNEQKCQTNLQALQQTQSSQNIGDIRSRLLNKIYDPLSGTSPENPQGTFNNPGGFDANTQYQQLGYITGPNGRYPVMGRYRNGRTDRFQYYIIDNERGRIKINFRTKNDNELYDGDSVNIDELGGEFKFKKYEDIDGNRYIPVIR